MKHNITDIRKAIQKRTGWTVSVIGGPLRGYTFRSPYAGQQSQIDAVPGPHVTVVGINDLTLDQWVEEFQQVKYKVLASQGYRGMRA